MRGRLGRQGTPGGVQRERWEGLYRDGDMANLVESGGEKLLPRFSMFPVLLRRGEIVGDEAESFGTAEVGSGRKGELQNGILQLRKRGGPGLESVNVLLDR